METLEKKGKRNHVRTVPEGLHTVTPFLVVDGALRFIDFIERAFNGTLTSKTMHDSEHVMHAQVKIGSSAIMVADIMEGMEQQVSMLYLYIEDVDRVFKQATDAGAKLVREVRNEFYGDRAGAIKDKWGNTWWIATHVEDVADDELERRAKEVVKTQGHHGT